MKKFTIFALVIVLTFALTACGRRDDTPTQTTPQATNTPTDQATMPTIDPTMGTNIPDPEVDTGMPDMMDPSQDTQLPTGGNSNGDQNGSGSSAGQGSTGGMGATGGQ